MTFHAGRVAAVALSTLALVGCSPDEDETDAPPVVQLGSPGEPGRELTEDEASALAQPGHTPADVAFVQGMIHHHQQALLMTTLVPDRTDRDDIPLLAERMDVSQRDEIAQLEAWLGDRDEEVPAESSHEHHGNDTATMMPGMLTEAELDELDAASGAGFDQLFLQYMIRHHEGAVTMVAELLATPGAGQDSELFRFASDVDADQRAEIRRMRTVLDALPAGMPRR